MLWQSKSSNGAAGIWAKAEQLQKQAEAAVLRSAQAVATTYAYVLKMLPHACASGCDFQWGHG